MNKYNKLASIITALTLLSACGGDSDDDNDSGADSGNTSIKIVSIAGTTTNLTGQWESNCNTSGGADQKEILVFNKATVAYSHNSYTTTDMTCAGTSSTTKSYAANITTGDVLAIAGWLGGDREAGSPPTAQDGTALTENESFTDLMYEITSVSNMGNTKIGDKIQNGYIADNTTNDITLYRLDNNNPNPSYGINTDEFRKIITN